MEQEKVVMKGYKGFGKGLVCRGKKYAENEVFEEDDAEICECGMHFCENPMDVLDHYPLIDEKCDISDYAEVEALGEVKGDEKKRCTNKLKIGAKLSFSGFVKACIEFMIEKTAGNNENVDSGNYAKMASSGYSAKMASSGYSAKMASSGDSAQMASSGDYAQMASGGYSAKMASSGNYAKMASSGNYAKMASSGDSAQMASSGDYAKMASSGEDSVICCAGVGGVAKAKKGNWITLSEWSYSKEKQRFVPICVKTEFVDGKKIKEDVWYSLKNNEFAEVE